MIVGMLKMVSRRENNRAAIVSKELIQYLVFGSHIGRPNSSRSNWLALGHLVQETTYCSIQSLF